MPKLRTTAIGSLPHHNIDAAIAVAFQCDIPFLPQIPIRNPWEYMIPQALEGLAGLRAERDGSIGFDPVLWEARSHELDRRLENAFASEDGAAFESFEPSGATSSCWQPFVWELEERHATEAKVQIAGPMTAQWSLPGGAELKVEPQTELATQIFRLVLARGISMVRRLKRAGIARPVLFLDEPGFFAFSKSNPRHVLALQELRVILQTLTREGAQVGIHCCSDTDWETLLALPLAWLSLDTELSLPRLLDPSHRPALLAYLARGRLSLGAIPTNSDLRGPRLAVQLVDRFSAAGLSDEEVFGILDGSLITPACGLALHAVPEAELVLALLPDVAKALAP